MYGYFAKKEHFKKLKLPEKKLMDCTRRHFLKIAGVCGAATLLDDTPLFAEPSALSNHSKPQYGLLNDGTKCIGCHSCENACREYNSLPPLETEADGNIIYPTQLDADTFTRIESRTIAAGDSGTGETQTFRRFQCNHCLHPSCASACPVGALVKSPEGPVYYKPERCIGCRYCISACPFSIPKYQWASTIPFVRKCTMCYEKVSRGEPTSCASVCPTGAIKFGSRDLLLAEARQSISLEPDRYHNHIYGEQEVGGTNILYISSSAVALEDFGFLMGLGNESYPSLTWAALSRVPGIAIYVVAWVTFVYFITQHRIPEELRNKESR